MGESIQVVATITAKDGAIDQLVEALTGALEPTRAEEGCLRYDCFRVRREENTIIMLEEWASKDALRAHGAGENFRALSARLADLCAEPPGIRILDPVEA